MRNKIERLTIKGFKSIREMVNFSLGDVNIVVGANGAGKSNFVQIFRMVRAMLNKGFQSFIATHGGAVSFLHNGLKVTKVIEAEFNFAKNSYSFTLTPTADEMFTISEYKRFESYGWSCYGTGLKESRLADEKDDKSFFYSNYGNYSGVGHYGYDAISRVVVYHFHDTSDSAPMRQSEIVEDNAYLREDGANIAPFLKALREDESEGVKSYRQIVDAIRLVMPFFDDFSLTPISFGPATKVKLTWKQKGTDYPFQPYHLSDGAIRFICLATALLQPKPPSTIIIDEPELGLHPQAIAILSDLIKSAASRTQVIIATQSPHLVDQFAVNDIIVAKRKDGATVFGRLNENDYSAWLEDFTLGELWTRNIIEGGPTYE